MGKLYTDHKPKFVYQNGKTIYVKHESDDNFLFRKTKSISINAEQLEKSDLVQITLAHRNVVISATAKDIKANKDVKTFYGEVKYYLPIEKWNVVAGDNGWVEKINNETSGS